MSLRALARAPEQAILTTVFDLGEDPEEHLGQPAYAYHAVYRAFAPLLKHFGSLVEVRRPESELDYTIWRVRQDEGTAVALNFLPFQAVYLSRHVANVIYPLWEYPDIPNVDLAGNPRENWVQMANQVSLILTANTHTAEAFKRAGVVTPVCVVPAPVRPEFFGVGSWSPTAQTRLNCPAVVFPQPESAVQPATIADPWQPWATEPTTMRAALRSRLRRLYQTYLRQGLPKSMDRQLTLLVRRLRALRANWRAECPNSEKKPYLPHDVTPTLQLSGMVYTICLNPFDTRENWNDLLSAYLLALRDQEDATLVVKPAFPPSKLTEYLCHLVESYQRLSLRHRCKVAFLADVLPDDQMLALAQGTTYYLTASRAKRACLTLQDFLAAGRPAVGPSHTAYSDCLREDRGFVVSSQAEPTYWPNDPERCLLTSWQRIVWQSLHDRIAQSYDVAKHSPSEYQSRAACARRGMEEWAGAERVESLLAAAFSQIKTSTCHSDSSRQTPRPSACTFERVPASRARGNVA